MQKATEWLSTVQASAEVGGTPRLKPQLFKTEVGGTPRLKPNFSQLIVQY